MHLSSFVPLSCVLYLALAAVSAARYAPGSPIRQSVGKDVILTRNATTQVILPTPPAQTPLLSNVYTERNFDTYTGSDRNGSYDYIVRDQFAGQESDLCYGVVNAKGTRFLPGDSIAGLSSSTTLLGSDAEGVLVTGFNCSGGNHPSGAKYGGVVEFRHDPVKPGQYVKVVAFDLHYASPSTIRVIVEAFGVQLAYRVVGTTQSGVHLFNGMAGTDKKAHISFIIDVEGGGAEVNGNPYVIDVPRIEGFTFETLYGMVNNLRSGQFLYGETSSQTAMILWTEGYDGLPRVSRANTFADVAGAMYSGATDQRRGAWIAGQLKQRPAGNGFPGSRQTGEANDFSVIEEVVGYYVRISATEPDGKSGQVSFLYAHGWTPLGAITLVVEDAVQYDVGGGGALLVGVVDPQSSTPFYPPTLVAASKMASGSQGATFFTYVRPSGTVGWSFVISGPPVTDCMVGVVGSKGQPDGRGGWWLVLRAEDVPNGNAQCGIMSRPAPLFGNVAIGVEQGGVLVHLRGDGVFDYFESLAGGGDGTIPAKSGGFTVGRASVSGDTLTAETLTAGGEFGGGSVTLLGGTASSSSEAAAYSAHASVTATGTLWTRNPLDKSLLAYEDASCDPPACVTLPSQNAAAFGGGSGSGDSGRLGWTCAHVGYGVSQRAVHIEGSFVQQKQCEKTARAGFNALAVPVHASDTFFIHLLTMHPSPAYSEGTFSVITTDFLTSKPFYETYEYSTGLLEPLRRRIVALPDTFKEADILLGRQQVLCHGAGGQLVSFFFTETASVLATSVSVIDLTAPTVEIQGTFMDASTSSPYAFADVLELQLNNVSSSRAEGLFIGAEVGGGGKPPRLAYMCFDVSAFSWMAYDVVAHSGYGGSDRVGEELFTLHPTRTRLAAVFSRASSSVLFGALDGSGVDAIAYVSMWNVDPFADPADAEADEIVFGTVTISGTCGTQALRVEWRPLMNGFADVHYGPVSLTVIPPEAGATKEHVLVGSPAGVVVTQGALSSEIAYSGWGAHVISRLDATACGASSDTLDGVAPVRSYVMYSQCPTARVCFFIASPSPGGKSRVYVYQRARGSGVWAEVDVREYDTTGQDRGVVPSKSDVFDRVTTGPVVVDYSTDTFPAEHENTRSTHGLLYGSRFMWSGNVLILMQPSAGTRVFNFVPLGLGSPA